MKISKVIQVLLTLILVAGIINSFGCSNYCSGANSKGFPEEWAAVFPAVEGGSPCKQEVIRFGTTAYDSANLNYEDTTIPDLLQKYKEKYLNDGWSFDTRMEGKAGRANVSKGDVSALLSFTGGCALHGNPKCVTVHFDNVKLKK